MTPPRNQPEIEALIADQQPCHDDAAPLFGPGDIGEVMAVETAGRPVCGSA